jgi:tRNA(fMet)-specific endonuclease VapC
MLQFMLDTNVCIHVMRNYPEELRERFNRLAEQLCISTVTLGELYHAAEKSARRLANLETVELFAARLDVLAFGREAAAHYGQIRASLERRGRPVGAYDMMIGAHARSAALVLVTNNTRDFERIEGLRLDNWV